MHNVKTWLADKLPGYKIQNIDSDGNHYIPHRPGGNGREVSIREKADGEGVIINLFNGESLSEFLLKNNLTTNDLCYETYKAAAEPINKPSSKSNAIKEIAEQKEPNEPAENLEKYHIRTLEPNRNSRYMFLEKSRLEPYTPTETEITEINKLINKSFTLEGFEVANVKLNKQPYCIVFDNLDQDKNIILDNGHETTLYFEGRTDFLTAASLCLADKFNLVSIFNKQSLTKGIELLDTRRHIIFIDNDQDNTIFLSDIKLDTKNLIKNKFTHQVETIKISDIDSNYKDFSDFIFNNPSISIFEFDFDVIEKYSRMLKQALYSTLDASKIVEPETTIKFCNQSFGVRGDLSVIFGAAGVGKSSVCETLIATFIKNENDEDDEKYLEFEIPSEVKKMLYIDTERTPSKYAKSIKRAFYKANKPYSPIYKNNSKSFEALKFSDLLDKNTSIELLNHVIVEKKPDVIIIDLVSDFIDNVNDIPESNKLVKLLKGLAESYNINLICVMHANEGNQTNQNRARGHLGAELQRKASGVLKVERSGADPNVSILKTEKMSIGSNAETYFYYDDDSNMHLKCEKPGEASNKDLERKDILFKCFKKHAILKHTDLVKLIQKLSKKSAETAKRWIKLETNNLLEKEGDYYKYKLNIH